MDIVREEMQAPEDIAASQEFCDAFSIYDQKLNERRFLDFSSMMANAVRTLETNKSILDEVKKRFTYITVDEYQDINPIQEKLIKLLTGERGKSVRGWR